MPGTGVQATDPLSRDSDQLYFPNRHERTHSHFNLEDDGDVKLYEESSRCCCGVSGTKRAALLIFLFALFVGTVVGIGVTVATVAQEETTATTNVVLVVLDDAGWADFSFNSQHPENPYSLIETPNMDSFFRKGAYYSNFHSSVVCTPSRASMMTGRYLHNLGMQIPETLQPCVNGAIPLDNPTYAEYTRAKGFTNHYVGKWNIGMASWLNTPLGRGWDTFYGALNHPWVFRSGYSWVTIDVDYTNWEFQATPEKIDEADVFEKCLGEVCQGDYTYAVFNSTSQMCYCTDLEPMQMENTDWGAMQMFFISDLPEQDWWNGTNPASPEAGKSGDDLLMEEAFRILGEKAESNDPWTLTIALTNPHIDVSYPTNGTYHAIYPECSRFFDVSSDYYNYNRGGQCQRMRESDENFGNLIQEIRENGLWSNTLIILTNDNAPSTGQTGKNFYANYGLQWPYRGQKSDWFQGGVKGVLGLGGGALPSSFKGSSQNGLHDISDILPTVLAAAGYTSDELEALPVDGTPLLSLNLIEKKAHAYIVHWAPIYAAVDNNEGGNHPNGTVLRLGPWKYLDPVFVTATLYESTATGWYTLPEDESIDAPANFGQDTCFDNPQGGDLGCLYDLARDPLEQDAKLPSQVPASVIRELEKVLSSAIYTSDYKIGQAYTTAEECQNITMFGFQYFLPWLDTPDVLLDRAPS